MSPENFCYWLQGFFEITGKVDTLTPDQIKMVQDHLGYVFNVPKPQPSYEPSVFKPLKQEWKLPLDVTCPTGTAIIGDATFTPGSDISKIVTC